MPKNLITFEQAISHEKKRNPKRLADCLLTSIALQLSSNTIEFELIRNAAMYCYIQRLADLKGFAPIEKWNRNKKSLFLPINWLKRLWFWHNLGKGKVQS